MLYAELKRPEMQRLDWSDKVAVVPLGSLEQHGLHLPLYVDSFLGGELARRLEAALPQTVLLLPMQWLGASDHHLKFAGTVSLPSPLYIELVMHVCRCLLASGARRIFLLLSHGGNDVPCREAVNRLALERREQCDYWIASAGYWSLAAREMQLPQMETGGPTHACEYETSMMQALRPDLVEMQAARGDVLNIESRYYNPSSPAGRPIHVALPFEHLTGTGALGRPEAASPEKGEALFAAATGALVEFVKEFAAWPFPARAGEARYTGSQA